jgi:hypothetical protein
MDTRRFLGLVAILGTVGCAGSDSGGPAVLGLTIEEEPGIARGSFVDEAGRQVDFTSRFVDTNVVEIVVELNAMTITSMVDFDSGVIEYDGFSSDTGDDTQILDDDRAVLAGLTDALDHLGLEVSEPVDKLRAFVNRWQEYPTELELQGLALMDEDRGWTSLCGYMNRYVRSSHDCTLGCPWYNPFCSNSINSFWTDNTTVDWTYVSMHAAGPCSDGTYFDTSGNGSSWWRCYEPSHVSHDEGAYGNCFGRCGDGCGSNRQFTQDCLNHDECVRTGHSTGSESCIDQFESTADDWASAPNC